MARVAAVATIAAVVLLGCTSASTDTSETIATGPHSVSTVTTQSPTTSIAATSTETEPTTTTSSTSTTVPSTTTTTAHATTSTLPVSALVLRGDGLGIVSFGDPVEDVMATLADLFGPPSYDRLVESPFQLPDGWTGPDSGVAACHVATVPIFGGHICFDYIRVASWSDIGLRVIFSDLMVPPAGSDVDYVEVPPSLRGYGYRAGDFGPSAQTVQGVAVGTTVRELVALGDQVAFLGPGCGDNVEFFIDVPNPADGGRVYGVLDYESHASDTLESGYLDPASLDLDATVRWLAAGAQRSC